MTEVSFCLFEIVLKDRVLLCSFGWPGTYYVYQVGPKLTKIYLPLSQVLKFTTFSPILNSWVIKSCAILIPVRSFSGILLLLLGTSSILCFHHPHQSRASQHRSAASQLPFLVYHSPESLSIMLKSHSNSNKIQSFREVGIWCMKIQTNHIYL